jgi:hypothetical protein
MKEVKATRKIKESIVAHLLKGRAVEELPPHLLRCSSSVYDECLKIANRKTPMRAPQYYITDGTLSSHFWECYSYDKDVWVSDRSKAYHSSNRDLVEQILSAIKIRGFPNAGIYVQH